MAQRVVILGAAGRDFHNFNVCYRDNRDYDVVAFTAAQIPNIEHRRYPAALAGPLYPEGIPIVAERQLAALIAEHHVDVAVFSYSDVSHEHVMHLGSQVLAAGADYTLLGPRRTMLSARVPVIAICAARTGAGKSQTSRRVAGILEGMHKRVVLVRHPMPYGDLAQQAVQRFATYEDLARFDVTIEEREEYEPHLLAGRVVYAGVDYERILRQAEGEADIIVWDGGNNDLPFYKPDLHVVLLDPHRAADAAHYHPGETNVRMADVLVINKVGTAALGAVEETREVAFALNPAAPVIEAASPIVVEHGQEIRGKRALVIEDGPTTTHGGMPYGAGWVAARRYGAGEIVDPRPYAVGSIRDTFERYPHLGAVLPAMGYGPKQTAELAATINRTPADVIVIGTPVDLRHLIEMKQPALRVRYELQEIGKPDFEDILRDFVNDLR